MGASGRVVNQPVIVVGAGLSGLSCARELSRHAVPVQVFEAGDAVGGRVRTDLVDGFRCDRGFQVLLDSYAEPARLLDFDALELHPFEPGAVVWDGKQTHRVSDPMRRPNHLLATATSGVGSAMDKLRVLKLRVDAAAGRKEIPERSTLEELERRGFSPRMIDRFFRPFLGGVFIDPSLRTSNRMLMFVFDRFARGSACLPAKGMQAIPEQLAGGLPDGAVRLNAPVNEVRADGVTLSDGQRVSGRVVLATDRPAAAGFMKSGYPPPEGPSTTCLYFTASTPPTEEPVLMLNGSGRGRVNSVSVLTSVVPSYSEDGRPLISVTLTGDTTGRTDSELADATRVELEDWFPSSNAWELVHRVTVRNALPDQRPGGCAAGVSVIDGVVVTGDWRSWGSIHHAMRAGREAAGMMLRAFA